MKLFDGRYHDCPSGLLSNDRPHSVIMLPLNNIDVTLKKSKKQTLQCSCYIRRLY